MVGAVLLWGGEGPGCKPQGLGSGAHAPNPRPLLWLYEDSKERGVIGAFIPLMHLM